MQSLINLVARRRFNYVDVANMFLFASLWGSNQFLTAVLAFVGLMLVSIGLESAMR